MQFRKIVRASFISSVAAAALWTSSRPARANLITNGDFSANAGSYVTYLGYSSNFLPNVQANPASPTGWTITANYPVGLNGSGTAFTSGTPTPFAPSNMSGVTDFAFMQDASNYTGSAISQVIATVLGQTYTLSYVAAQRINNPSATMETLVNNALSGSPIASQNPTISTAAFTANSLTFTAVSSSTQIVFENTTSGTNGLDNTVDVSNVVVSDALPSPASFGLVSLGGAGLGLLLLKRRTGRSAIAA